MRTLNALVATILPHPKLIHFLVLEGVKPPDIWGNTRLPPDRLAYWAAQAD